MNLNRPRSGRRSRPFGAASLPLVVGVHLSIVGLDIGLISYFGGKVDLCGTHLISWLYGHCIIHTGLAACSGKLPECTLNNSFLDCCYFCLYALVYPGTIFGRIFEIVWVIYGMVLIHYTRSCAATFPFLYAMLCIGTVVLLGLRVFYIWNNFPAYEELPSYTISQNSIPFRSIQMPNSEACSICLETFKETVDRVRILSCCHVFHSACIDSWLTSHSRCPLCRQHVRIAVSL